MREEEIEEEIRKLNKDKEKYRAMIAQLKKVISELETAKGFSCTAYQGLEANYTTKNKSSEYTALGNIKTDIKTEIGKLEKIIQNSEIKINRITEKVNALTEERDTIRALKNT